MNKLSKRKQREDEVNDKERVVTCTFSNKYKRQH